MTSVIAYICNIGPLIVMNKWSMVRSFDLTSLRKRACLVPHLVSTRDSSELWTSSNWLQTRTGQGFHCSRTLSSRGALTHTNALPQCLHDDRDTPLLPNAESENRKTPSALDPNRKSRSSGQYPCFKVGRSTALETLTEISVATLSPTITRRYVRPRPSSSVTIQIQNHATIWRNIVYVSYGVKMKSLTHRTTKIERVSEQGVKENTWS
jgi:hypothetical protein